jgi:hypothetical protein
MPIVQISKIIHRTGSDDDLPQLDTGEIGFSTDERRVYIGNDPILYPPSTGLTTQTELLTEVSDISIAQVTDFVTTVPATSTSTGIKGQVAYNSTYIYLCVDTDTWIRALRNAW